MKTTELTKVFEAFTIHLHWLFEILRRQGQFTRFEKQLEMRKRRKGIAATFHFWNCMHYMHYILRYTIQRQFILAFSSRQFTKQNDKMELEDKRQ